ncbi:MAG: DUF11 domain-containing protein, partial [Candidatus Kapaibacterium sp.]
MSICSAQTPVGTEIRNQAWGSYQLKTGDGDTARSNATSTIVGAPSGTPRLALYKEADRAVAAPGSEITYTIVAANGGTATATDVIVTDTLPRNTSYISASGGGMVAGNIVRWTIGSIAVDGRDSMRLVVHIDEGMADGSLRNQAAAVCREELGIVSNTVVTQITAFVATEIRLAATPRAIAGNGLDSIALGVTIIDKDGISAGDGTAVFLWTSHGSFGNGHDTITAVMHVGIVGAILRSEKISGDNITASVHAVKLSASGRTLDDSITVVYYTSAIQGIIIAAVNHVPVAGAGLIAYDEQGHVVGYDTTGIDGRYIIPVPGDGIYTLLTVYTSEFGDRVERRTMVPVNVTSADGITMGKPVNAIDGYLIDRATGVPVRESGIKVAMHASIVGVPSIPIAADVVMVTNGNGRFLFDSLAPGLYEISVADSRYRGSVIVADTSVGEYLTGVHVIITEMPRLEITISSTKRIAEIGDVVGYTIDITNRSGVLALDPVWIIDTLPPGFGYVKGRARLDGSAAGDPSGSDIMVWRLPDT